MPIDVPTLHVTHPRIRASDWRSPLVARLQGTNIYADGRATIRDSFRDETFEEAAHDLTLVWAGLREDFTLCVNTYQAPVITEYATLGLACVLLTHRASLEITEVTRRGERVDYWIGDENAPRRYVLEVGGQQHGSLEELCDEKTIQLRDNPWARDGFVCVAIFSEATARLWYCSAEAPP
jgi:hypothetical protein